MAAHDSTKPLTPGPSPKGRGELERDIVAALRAVHDPEIPVNIYDLGLIYKLDVDDSGRVDVTMTLTTPNCPVAELIPNQVKKAIEGVPGVSSAQVSLTWTPPWTGERMTEDARMALDMMGISWKDPHGSASQRTTPVTIRKTKR